MKILLDPSSIIPFPHGHAQTAHGDQNDLPLLPLSFLPHSQHRHTSPSSLNSPLGPSLLKALESAHSSPCSPHIGTSQPLGLSSKVNSALSRTPVPALLSY